MKLVARSTAFRAANFMINIKTSQAASPRGAGRLAE
jgi:hypothetical protein